MFSFEAPLYLLGIPIILVLALLVWKISSKAQADKVFLLSNFNVLEEIQSERKDYKIYFLPFLQIISLILFCIALSEPSIIHEHLVKSAQVILSIDISKSMEATDFKPNRISVAREAALKFIDGLPKDVELGIQLFNKNVSLALPLTKDRAPARKVIQSLNIDSLGNGTAIGEALASSAQAFRLSGKSPTNKLSVNKNAKDTTLTQSKEDKHLILLSDGESNAGIEPLEALSKIPNVKVYTIGIGSSQGITVKGGLITQLDRDTLQSIASLTGGSYYEAWHDEAKLKDIYKSLTKNYRVERSKQPLFAIFVLIGLFTTTLSYSLAWTKFRGV